MNENKIVLQKHSATIAISNKLTLQQRKTYNFLLQHAKNLIKKDKDLVRYKVFVGEIKNSCNLKDTSNVALKSSIIDLMQTVVELNILDKDKKKSWTAFTLLSLADIKNGELTYEFNSLIRETLENPSIFALLDMNVIKGLSSKYSIALYELVEDYKKVSIPHMEIDTFRKLMGVEDKYKGDFSLLRKSVIIPAVSEINEKTEFTLEWEEVRRGRKIVELKFTHRRKPQKKEKKQTFFKDFRKFKEYVIENFQGREVCNRLGFLAESGNEYYPVVTFSISETGFVRNDHSGKDVSPKEAKLFWNWLFKNQQRVGDITEIEEIEELEMEYVGEEFKYVFQGMMGDSVVTLKLSEILPTEKEGFYTINAIDTESKKKIVGKNLLNRETLEKFHWLKN
jgi:plasmid replication initiation protein